MKLLRLKYLGSLGKPEGYYVKYEAVLVDQTTTLYEFSDGNRVKAFDLKGYSFNDYDLYEYMEALDETEAYDAEVSRQYTLARLRELLDTATCGGLQLNKSKSEYAAIIQLLEPIIEE